MSDAVPFVVAIALIAVDYIIVRAIVTLSNPAAGIAGPSPGVFRFLLMVLILNAAVLLEVMGSFKGDSLFLVGILAAFVLGGTDIRRERSPSGRHAGERSEPRNEGSQRSEGRGGSPPFGGD